MAVQQVLAESVLAATAAAHLAVTVEAPLAVLAVLAVLQVLS